MELLVYHNLKVKMVNNGQEAIKLLLSNKIFDAVLMDCMMPIMDGYDTTRKLRQYKRFKDLPIIALTANVMKGDREKVLACGMNDYIAKPIHPKQLFSVLAKWITIVAPKVLPNVQSDSITETALNTLALTHQNKFSKLPGIDAKVGLAITMNNTKLYRELLLRFRDNQVNFKQQFYDSINDKDPKACLRLIHTLKGVAASLGALEVYEAAQSLEQAYSNHSDHIEDHLSATVTALQVVLSGLEHLDQKSQKVNSETSKMLDINTELLEAIVKKLHQQLNQGDFNAMQMIKKLESTLSETDYAEDAHNIASTMADFDFDKAIQQLNNLSVKILSKPIS